MFAIRRPPDQFRKSGNAVTEKQVVEYLNSYFSLFESYLQNNNVSVMNTTLSLFIMEKFEKLFKLWDENRILEKSINKELFETIYSAMLNTFGKDTGSKVDDISSSINDVLFECRQCGEEIDLRNNNLQYSYDFHKTTVEHRELVEYFDKEREIDEKNFALGNAEECSPPVETNSSSSCVAQLNHVAPKMSDDELKTEFQLDSIIPCDTNTATPAKKNEKSKKKKLNALPRPSNIEVLNCNQGNILISEFDKECISIVQNRLECGICDVEMKGHAIFLSHVKGKIHKQKALRYELSDKFIAHVNDKVMCKLCYIPFPNIRTFVDHCGEGTHHSNQVLVLGSSVFRPFDYKYHCQFDVFTTEYKCSVCQLCVTGIKGYFCHLKQEHDVN